MVHRRPLYGSLEAPVWFIGGPCIEKTSQDSSQKKPGHVIHSKSRDPLAIT